jgi:sulfite reductase subunit B
MLTTEKTRRAAVANPYLPIPAEVVRATTLTALENLYELRLPDGKRLDHKPGQFVQVSIPGVGECPISVCSSPTRPDSFELAVRRVGEVTTAIHRLRAGDTVGVRGPLGRGFDVNQFFQTDVLIVVGGCALAPARSLIQFILDRRDRFGAFHLLYGGRSPAELLFRDELEAWQARKDVDCRVTVDRADDGWQGGIGVVTKLFEDLPHLNVKRTRAVVIGPPAMFRFAVLEVLRLGIAQEHIYCSMERRMKCGIGKCGHCQMNDLYACIDGPVFSYADIAAVREALS